MVYAAPDMPRELREPKDLGKDFVTTEEVSEVAGVGRPSLYEWLREGLLPAPKTTGGRGIIAKWPPSTLKIAKFVRKQRELGFGLTEIRPRIIAAFGQTVLEVLSEPRGPRARARKGKKLAKMRKN